MILPGIRTTRPLDNSPQTTRPQYKNTYDTLEKYIFMLIK